MMFWRCFINKSYLKEKDETSLVCQSYFFCGLLLYHFVHRYNSVLGVKDQTKSVQPRFELYWFCGGRQTGCCDSVPWGKSREPALCKKERKKKQSWNQSYLLDNMSWVILIYYLFSDHSLKRLMIPTVNFAKTTVNLDHWKRCKVNCQYSLNVPIT